MAFTAFLSFSNNHPFLVELTCYETHNSTAKGLIIHPNSIFFSPSPNHSSILLSYLNVWC